MIQPTDAGDDWDDITGDYEETDPPDGAAVAAMKLEEDRHANEIEVAKLESLLAILVSLPDSNHEDRQETTGAILSLFKRHAGFKYE
jgi:hypothetical protein